MIEVGIPHPIGWVTLFEAEAPIKLRSRPNWRGHWGDRHKATKRERDALFWALREPGVPPPKLPLIVHFVRVLGPREQRMDSDNLVAAFKAPRDELCRWLGVDDRSRDIGWRYEQDGSRRAEGPSVELRIFGRGEA